MSAEKNEYQLKNRRFFGFKNIKISSNQENVPCLEVN